MKCPLCESKKGRRIYKLCDNMKIMGENFCETPAYTARCDACGLVFTDTEATQVDFLSYYKNGAVAPKYYEMFGKEATDEYYKHLVGIFDKYINRDSYILDVAGSWGELANYLKENGYENVTDVDVNEKCIENAKEYGVSTLLADSSNMDSISDKSVDFVILNHTLEHVLDVAGTMNEIRRVLRDEGYLFIEIPDAEGYIIEEKAPLNFLTYEHVIHMTMNDLENLAYRYGFEIIDKDHYYKKVSNYPSIYAVLRKGVAREVNYSDLTEKSVKKYIAKSQAELTEFLNPLRVSQEPIILWGIGASTAILIDLFEGCNVVQLIDKNPKRQGIRFRISDISLTIESPNDIKEGTIVILSIPYSEAITKQIKEMNLDNKIVTLK